MASLNQSNKLIRQQWDELAMKAAIDAVRAKKMGWQLAAKTFNVPATTLRRRYVKCDTSKGDLGGRRTVLTHEAEEELANHIIDMETRFFGLTTKDLRRLVYEIAERDNLKHDFNKDNRMAGKKWIKGFLKRNSRISLRIPENTSVARAQAFNENNIKAYFTALDSTIREYSFTPENIFNVDESGLSTVQKRPQKIFATKGRKQVGVLSSAERGKHITVVCSMNAIGTFVPPVFIFSRKRFKNELMDNAPPGSKAFCQEKGWMNADIFLKWLQHFAQHTKPSIDKKVLLLLDGHSSHKSLNVLEYAKKNGIVLFCFPAHCSHRVQPLDVGFFGPLQIYYDQEIQLWLRQNPGRIVTDFQIAGLFKNAFLKSATPANAINSFFKTGISPFNPNIFEDWMFAPSLTTDEPMDRRSDSGKQDNQQPLQSKPEEHFTGSNQPLENFTDYGGITEDVHLAGPSRMEKIRTIIAEVSPSPVATSTHQKRKRRRGKTGILNSTPDILELKQKEEEKSAAEKRKSARTVKKKIMKEFSSDEEHCWDAIDDSESDVGCLYCNELYSQSRSKEMWIQCQKCRSWCHADCAGVDLKTKKFVCELCL